MNNFEKNSIINSASVNNLGNILKNYLNLNLSPYNIVDYYRNNVLEKFYKNNYFDINTRNSSSSFYFQNDNLFDFYNRLSKLSTIKNSKIYVNKYNYNQYFNKFSYIDNSFPKDKFIVINYDFFNTYIYEYVHNSMKNVTFDKFEYKCKQPKYPTLQTLDLTNFHNFITLNQNTEYYENFETINGYASVLPDIEKDFLISYFKNYTNYNIPNSFFVKNKNYKDLISLFVFYKKEKKYFIFVLMTYLKYKKEIIKQNDIIKEEYNKKLLEYDKLKLAEDKQYEFEKNKFKTNYIKNKTQELEEKIYSKIREHNNKLKNIIKEEYEDRLTKDINEYNNNLIQELNSKIQSLNNTVSTISLFETDKLKQLIYLLPLPSFYSIDLSINYNPENKILLINYKLPLISDLNDTYYAESLKEKKYSKTFMNNFYENLLYQITFIVVDFCFKISKEISSVVFNGYVNTKDTSTGKDINPCILSLLVDRKTFEGIDLKYIEPKDCFKALKGVKPPKFENIVPITPIMTFNKNDKRFVEGYDVINTVNQGDNLASMDWQDFENLVRDLFELEFNKNGGEVKITQASRDGGVDAIAFDPDPIRGGKIIIQAKRYTNVVGVSAVRDLYGTVVNEGANKGILITTAGYGSDAYNFAKDKPLTLLDGGHLLGLLEKHGIKAYINLQEAKNLANK